MVKKLDGPTREMTSDQQLIQRLLSRMEGETLDFKRDQYPLESGEQKSKFVQDLICMANTPRDESAYILIGVEDKNGRAGALHGSSEHPDPSVFQNLIVGNTNPSLRFSYRTVEYLGVVLGLFEIPMSWDVPVMASKRIGKLTPGIVHFRLGAQNSVAGPVDVRRIVDWANQRGGNSEGNADGALPENSWESFFRACDYFDPGNVFVAVVSDTDGLTMDDAESFSQIGWQLILDFDQTTNQNGLYSKVEGHLSSRRSLSLIALDEPLNPAGPSASIWIAVKGLSNRPSTTQTHRWREWNQAKVPRLSAAVTSLARMTEPHPVKAIVFGREPDYLETVCDVLDQGFKNRLSFVFAGERPDQFAQLESRFEGSTVAISLPAICAGLRSLRSPTETARDVELPHLNGGTVTVPPDRARWLEEEVEIVHGNVGLDSSNSDLELQNFLKGNLISWHGLNLGVDVGRTKTAALQERVLEELNSRTTRRLNLWHWPGGGGSTLGRRIAWNVHTSYPTVVASRVLLDQLRDRLQFVFSLTQKPVLVIVEDSVTGPDDLDRVYDRLRSANIPAVLLRIGRRNSASTESGSVYLNGILDNTEAVAFAGKLIAEVPSRRAELEKLRESSGDTARRLRTPFYFGLVAFGRDFAGLEPYVAHRLSEASEQVLDVCKISSLLYHFGQQATPVQLLAPILSLPRDRRVRLNQVIPSLIQELFVQESDRSVRPAHELIANEILEQVLGSGLEDKRNWRSGLAQCTVEAIEAAAQHHDHPGGATANLVRSVVIERGMQETPSGFLEGQFSDLINAIPSSDGQCRVLETLTELFPDEAHFWAHLGRFYTRILRNHAAAYESHNKSLQIAPNDPVLYHMAGMALRGELYELQEHFDPSSFDVEEERRAQVLVEEALNRFLSSRELDPRSEHSYISAIELIARTVRVVARLKGHGEDTAEFLVAHSEGWYRELVDTAETLIAEQVLARAGDEPSRFLQQAQANLNRAYGDISRAIQGWNNLLDPRRGAYRPPLRRNIINAYLTRRNRDWSQLTERELERISILVQENLEEEPDSDQNLRMWLRVVRATGDFPLSVIAERLTYKSIRQPTLDTLYYLFICKFLQSHTGLGRAADEAKTIIDQCAQMAANLPHRTRSFEWLGNGVGIKALVHESALGDWDASSEFWSHPHLLQAATGRIASIRTPGAGEIELSNGLKAFFVPARGRIDGGYLGGRDINRPVGFFLGFSYDGLRAWSVREPDNISGNH